MFSIRRPSDESIRRQIAEQAGLEYTYGPVGATAAEPPRGYALDHTRARLGGGADAFAAAVDGLRGWQQFRLGWLEAVPADAPLATGSVVAVVARAMGLWSVNFARIVYAIDEQVGDVRRFGFAYGTLPDHVEAGEERFSIEWDTRDESVYYDILAFSRPRHWLVRLSFPLARRMQRRFARESVAAMQRFVQDAAGVTRAV